MTLNLLTVERSVTRRFKKLAHYFDVREGQSGSLVQHELRLWLPA